MLKRTGFLSIALALAVVLSSSVRTASAKNASDERERAVKAADVLTEIMQIPESGIPDELMARAEAVAVFPHVVKGAFGVGGEYGHGLVSERRADGRWSPHHFLKSAAVTSGCNSACSRRTSSLYSRAATDLKVSSTVKLNLAPTLL